MSEVFVSYARQDVAIARRVTAALEAAGFTVWWDADLPAHRAYSEVIETRLRDAEAVVALWSRSSAQSQWVRAEADYARSAGKLVQAQVDGTVPPIPFNQIQCADLKGWRGNRNHAGWSKVEASVGALLGGEEPRQTRATEPERWWQVRQARWAMAAGALLLILAAFLLSRFIGASDEKPIVAVLPFESLDNRDESLVAGIWEDTRQALSRNPQLLVLGPNTSEQLAEDSKGARRAADYLVEASVRSAGDRIRVSANLIRTDDNAQMWSESFDRRIDDVFKLQQQIAGEIEGRIRGRLAERGGTLPEHIVTSGEVYALYSDARIKIRRRQPESYGDAVLQLRRVVEMDPNFAPGWATLAVAERITRPSELQRSQVNQAETYARRAIALAPNLATGHAALALTLNLHGPVAEAELNRAVALDPNDFEALNWLASLVKSKGNLDGALKLYARVAEIEPLWWPAILNKVDVLLERRDYDGADQEVERLRNLGASRLAAMAGMDIAKSKGDLSAAADLGLAEYKREPPSAQRDSNSNPSIFEFSLWSLLLQLGYVEEVDEIGRPPPFAGPLRRNDPRALDMIEKLNLPPSKFFTMHPLPMAAGRVYLLSGRASTYAELYRSVATSPDKAAAIGGSPQDFVTLAPYIALALQGVGDDDEARRVLDAAERIAKADAFIREPPQQAALARVHSAQGQHDEALGLLTAAVNGGWLPEPPGLLTDIALDPALAKLKGDPRFGKLRQRILDHLAKERAELGPVKLN